MRASDSKVSYYPKPPHYSPLVAEKSSSYLFFTERHIQAMWLEQKYFRSPTLQSGEQIRVISPGIRNCGAGPDFHKAHIFIGAQEFKGDIEIHFTQTDWEAHGHFNDPNYDQVILHVCLWKSSTAYMTRRCDGRAIPTLFLEDFLTIGLDRISSLIDLEQYPYRKFIGSGRCSRQLFDKIDKEKSSRLLQDAALRRLEEKSVRLISRAGSREWAFPLGIARALGYKPNGEAFEQLFLELLPHRDRPFDELLALALGVCGFFSPDRIKKWQGISRYEELKTLWPLLAPIADQQIQLTTHQIRPINHPVRRIALMIHLLNDPYLIDLENVLFQSYQYGESLQKLSSRLPVYSDSYWNSRYTFSNDPQDKFLSLLGDDLKSQIMINAFYPLLYERLLTDPEALSIFLTEYRSIHSLPSGKSEYLTHRFFGDQQNGEIMRLEMHQQGAYQIHKDYCVHYEASCEGCPFVDRVLHYD